MRRIERVAEILERLGGNSALAVVEPDRDKRKQSQTLLNYLKRMSEKLYFIIIPAQNFDVYHIHHYKLSYFAPPFSAREEIEHQHHKHARAEVVDHFDSSTLIKRFLKRFLTFSSSIIAIRLITKVHITF